MTSAALSTSAEILQQMYERHGPIYPASYDQARAMQRVVGPNGAANGQLSASPADAPAGQVELHVLTLNELVSYEFPQREPIVEP